MKLWETEKFTLNLKTGELMRSLSNMYIQGENFEHAYKRLLESNLDWLRLTGNWFLDKENLPSDKAEGLKNNTPIITDNKDEEDEQDDTYHGFKGFNFNPDDLDDDDDDEQPEFKPYVEPKTFTGYDEKDWKDFLKAKTEFLESLDLDQLFDWLTTLEKPQVDDVWKTCVEYGLLERVKVVEGYLKYRYGKEDKEGLQ